MMMVRVIITNLTLPRLLHPSRVVDLRITTIILTAAAALGLPKWIPWKSLNQVPVNHNFVQNPLIAFD